MTDGPGDRPQDVGRSRRRKGRPSAETAALLERYQGAMRADLGAVLTELEPVPPAPGLGLVDEAPKRPDLGTRTKLWDLAIKLGRELGSAIDAPTPADDAPNAAPRRRRPDFG